MRRIIILHLGPLIVRRNFVIVCFRGLNMRVANFRKDLQDDKISVF